MKAPFDNIQDYSLAILNSTNLVDALFNASGKLEERMRTEGINPLDLKHIHLDSIVSDLVNILIDQQAHNFQVYGLFKPTPTKKGEGEG